MIGGDSDDIGAGMVFFYILVVLFLLGLAGTQIYFNIMFFKDIKALQIADQEIKSKIGSIIRDINFNNKQEYIVDTEQQTNINILNNKVGL